MTFTKVTNTGIGSTGTVLLQNLDVIGIATVGFGVSTVDVFTTGITTFANATDSTSTTTGSVIVSGGVGIAGSLNVGGSVSVGGTLTYEDVTNVDSVGIITARSNILVGSGITLSPDGHAFVAGVSTIGTLAVSGIATVGGVIDSSTGTVTSSGDMTVGGKLIISGNSSVKDIEYGNGNTAGYFRSNTNVNRANADAAIHLQQFRWNNTKVAEIKVLTGDDTTNKDNAHITFETASAGTTSERLRILSSGGLTFSGDTAAANALNDYEEGDWTPSLAQGSPTYNTQIGKYTKIGELVLLSFYLDYSNGSNGSQRIAGLPFVPDATREGSTSVSRLGSVFDEGQSAGNRVMHSISHTSQGTTRAYVDLIINVAAKGIRGTFMYRAA